MKKNSVLNIPLMKQKLTQPLLYLLGPHDLDRDTTELWV